MDKLVAIVAAVVIVVIAFVLFSGQGTRMGTVFNTRANCVQDAGVNC